MAYITNTEVRERLRTLNSTTEIPEAILNSHSFVTTGDAWLDTILENSGKSYGALLTAHKNLAKAAEIAWVAAKIVNSAPMGKSKKGPLEVEDVDPQARKLCLDTLKEEWMYMLELIGVEMSVTFCGDFGIDSLNDVTCD